MRHFHFYDETTGILHGDSIAVNAPAGHEEAARANCPSGHRHIEGHFDPLSQRVDVATGAVVDYQPLAPSAGHEWNAATKRWQLKPDVAQRQAQSAAAFAQITALEGSQPRVVREAVLGQPGAAERLRALDAEIAELRRQLS